VSAASRFESRLTDSCTVKRKAVSRDADLDLVLGEETTATRNLACLFCPMEPSTDMIAASPESANMMRLLAAEGADLQQHDVVVDRASGEEYVITQRPVVRRFQGAAHHVEALLERKVVS